MEFKRDIQKCGLLSDLPQETVSEIPNRHPWPYAQKPNLVVWCEYKK